MRTPIILARPFFQSRCKVTHPRQTLIQPDVPVNAPKVDVQLPNMVQWATAAPPKPQLQLSPTAAAPKMKERDGSRCCRS